MIIWILTQKIVYRIWILDPDLDFLLIPDPEVKKKAPDFGAAILRSIYLEHGEEEGVGSSALRHLRQLGQLDLVGGEAPGGQVRQPALHRLQAAVGPHQAAQPLLAVDLNTRREYLKIRRKSRCSVENYKKRMSTVKYWQN